MSDLGRKSFTDKASEAIKPDSQKSTFEKASESVSDTFDKAASSITPENQKSAGQSVSDSLQSGYDQGKSEVSGDAKTLSETANEYLHSGAEAAAGAVEAGKQSLADAAAYVGGAFGGAKEGAESTKK
ncbi:hypothetical protein B5S28_g730 [[Candida] boidinii]|uniref:Unnamed protein product n=1 Tax=Candida boidinii TaxID=5477 RepID=A0ACB5U213_CANBO|nr:hypothetical protein B5S28_g730 [[Candida] boidinii]OWB60312.1 hypothetical protein B5S29_g1184 [[Candida] boidinii]OWB72076.1 hypothetical protein B5S31_g1777 [[Candida] boidinii]OWB77707.1 hypothetical protein B5S32_g1881 [[Candida] boidinii]GME97706.1 unnamed protein product [[Candida] boidinii]